MRETMAAHLYRPYDLTAKRVWVAGHRGMVGAAIVRRLATENCDIITVDRSSVDLTRQEAVEHWIAETRPQAIFLAAAKVGGILANSSSPATFVYDNVMIEANVTHAAWRSGVEKLVFLGSSCIYPKHAPQPIPEEALLTGSLEPTNEWYAIAKIAGIKLCHSYRLQYGCNFVSAMPTNLYGPGDNFDLGTSHVLPALVRKAHEAKVRGDNQLVIWGTGTPRREFLHVDDCADALIHIMKVYSGADHINIGFGADVTINDLARLVAEVVGFKGEIVHDLSKPDGTPRKLMNGGRMRTLGWRPNISLRQGIADTYRSFLSRIETAPRTDDSTVGSRSEHIGGC